jgi:hypothetical protein
MARATDAVDHSDADHRAGLPQQRREWPREGGSSGRRLSGRRGAAALALLVLFASLAAACGGGASDVSARQVDGDAEGSATAVGTPNPSIDPTVEGVRTISTVADLVAEFGDPAGYDYARFRIPKLGVDAPVGISIVDSDRMGTPQGPATVFWYDLSAFEGLGGRPGEGSNAIFSGHVDLSTYLSYADVNYHGQAVFSGLALLAPGDRVFVDVGGETLEYQVKWAEQLGAGSNARWSEVLSSNVEVDSITFYTCGGDFDSTSRSYADRIVVRAERV